MENHPLNRYPQITFARAVARSYIQFNKYILQCPVDGERETKLPTNYLTNFSIAIHCPSGDMDLHYLKRLIMMIRKGDRKIIVGDYSGDFLLQCNLIHTPNTHGQPLYVEVREIEISAASLIRHVKSNEYVTLPMLSHLLCGTNLEEAGFELFVQCTWAQDYTPPFIDMCLQVYNTTHVDELSRFRELEFEMLHCACSTVHDVAIHPGDNVTPVLHVDHPDTVYAGLFFIQFRDGIEPTNFHAVLHMSDTNSAIIDKLRGRHVHKMPMIKGCYFLDFGTNITLFSQSNQPCGHEVITKESRLQFMSDVETHITVTVIYFSELRYNVNDDIITLHEHELLLTEQAVERAALRTASAREYLRRDELNDAMEAGPIDQTLIVGDEYGEDQMLPVEIGEYLLREPPPSPPLAICYKPQDISEVINNYLEQQAPYRKTWEECCIEYQPINEGDYYIMCVQCKNVVKLQAMYTWFAINAANTCPVCRSNMRIPIIYRNRRKLWYAVDWVLSFFNN